MRADVRQAEQMKAFVDACVTKYGRLDIAFNNAGIDYPPHAIADTPITVWLASEDASYVSGGQFSVDGGGLG